MKAACLALMLFAPLAAACQSPAGEDRSTRPFDAIAETETISFVGTEPFWGGESTGASLTYTTIENPDGTQIPVRRFAGNSGLSLSGMLGSDKFDMVITQGECSDGMSDRSFPYTVTLQIGAEQRNGCAWTSAQPFSGPANP